MILSASFTCIWVLLICKYNKGWNIKNYKNKTNDQFFIKMKTNLIKCTLKKDIRIMWSKRKETNFRIKKTVVACGNWVPSWNTLLRICTYSGVLRKKRQQQNLGLEAWLNFFMSFRYISFQSARSALCKISDRKERVSLISSVITFEACSLVQVLVGSQSPYCVSMWTYLITVWWRLWKQEEFSVSNHWGESQKFHQSKSVWL